MPKIWLNSKKQNAISLGMIDFNSHQQTISLLRNFCYDEFASSANAFFLATHVMISIQTRACQANNAEKPNFNRRIFFRCDIRRHQQIIKYLLFVLHL